MYSQVANFNIRLLFNFLPDWKSIPDMQVCLKNKPQMIVLEGCEASLPYDFFVRSFGKGHINISTNKSFPIINSIYNNEIIIRTLMLNYLRINYSSLWQELWSDSFNSVCWSKNDIRLVANKFSSLTNKWSNNNVFLNDY